MLQTKSTEATLAVRRQQGTFTRTSVEKCLEIALVEGKEWSSEAGAIVWPPPLAWWLLFLLFCCSVGFSHLRVSFLPNALNCRGVWGCIILLQCTYMEETHAHTVGGELLWQPRSKSTWRCLRLVGAPLPNTEPRSAARNLLWKRWGSDLGLRVRGQLQAVPLIWAPTTPQHDLLLLLLLLSPQSNRQDCTLQLQSSSD